MVTRPRVDPVTTFRVPAASIGRGSLMRRWSWRVEERRLTLPKCACPPTTVTDPQVGQVVATSHTDEPRTDRRVSAAPGDLVREAVDS